jgi:hypothetical protein
MVYLDIRRNQLLSNNFGLAFNTIKKKRVSSELASTRYEELPHHSKILLILHLESQS